MIRESFYRLSLIALAAAVLAGVGCATAATGGSAPATPAADLETTPPVGASENGRFLTTREMFDPPVSEDAAVGVIDADDYDAAYRAAIETLRDAGYRVARDDYRFGTITTYPKEAPTVFEPWVGDNTTWEQAREATLNDLRRVVTVQLRQEDFLREFAEGHDLQLAGGLYGLVVEVAIQRRQEPTRYLTHSARGRVIAQYAEAPARLARRGLDETYWEPIGADPHLAQRLLDEVRGRIPGPEPAEGSGR